MHTQKVRTRFNLLREAWQLARERFPAAAPLPEKLDSRAVEAQLHATILEMVGACITLFEHGNYWPMPVLLRVAHEALAEQLALERDPTYLKDMVATTLEEGRSLPEHINQQQRGLLQAFLAEPGARDFLGRIKDSAAEVATDGGEHVDIQKKFERAGLENEYPLHRMLGGSVHNDLGALQQRHAERAADGTKRLALFRVPSELDLLNSLDSALASLLRSYRSFHRGAGELQPFIDKFAEHLREERGAGPRRLSQLDRYVGTRESRSTRPRHR
jgi:hypothetical protein